MGDEDPNSGPSVNTAPDTLSQLPSLKPETFDFIISPYCTEA